VGLDGKILARGFEFGWWKSKNYVWML